MTLTAHEGYEVLEGESGTDAYVIFDDEPELQIEISLSQPRRSQRTGFPPGAEAAGLMS